jgi:hypothetical protein
MQGGDQKVLVKLIVAPRLHADVLQVARFFIACNLGDKKLYHTIEVLLLITSFILVSSWFGVERFGEVVFKHSQPGGPVGVP